MRRRWRRYLRDVTASRRTHRSFSISTCELKWSRGRPEFRPAGIAMQVTAASHAGTRFWNGFRSLRRTMDAQSLDGFRRRLLTKKIKLTGQMNGKSGGEELFSENGSAEMIDLAQTIEQVDRLVSLQDQERQELAMINEALGKIPQGLFGICEDCDETIGMKRLEIIPEARLCARCQTVEERERSRHARNPREAA